MLASIFIFSSCDNEDTAKEDDNDSTDLPNYILLDQNLGNQDYAILGLDGSGYFYEFSDANPSIPQRLSIYDGNKNSVDLVINFDEEGLPKNILSENFTIVLGKYEGNKFDAVIITKNGESQTFENIETDFSWTEYKNAMSGIVSRSPIQMRASVSNNPWEWVNAGVSVVGCALSVATAATVVTAGLAVISCGSAYANLLQVSGVEIPKIINDVSTLGDYAGLIGCARSINNKLEIWDCVTTLAGMVTSWAASRENSEKDDVKLGEAILNSPTITSPSYGATYHCGDWIDIFVSGYTGADWQDYLELQYWCLRGEPQPNNANESYTYTNKAYPRKEANYSFTFSPEDLSVWEGHWVKLVAHNKKNNTWSAPQYILIGKPDISQIMNGTLSGIINQPSGNIKQYEMAVNFDRVNNKFTVEYPSLGCGGNIVFLRYDNDKAVFKEEIEHGTNVCIPIDWIVFEKKTNTCLSVSIYRNSGLTNLSCTGDICK